MAPEVGGESSSRVEAAADTQVSSSRVEASVRAVVTSSSDTVLNAMAPAGGGESSSHVEASADAQVSSSNVEGPAPDGSFAALALAARDLRRFWRRQRPADFNAAITRTQIRLADYIATQLEARYRRTASRRWRDWTRKSLREGGRKVSQWVRQPENWAQAPTIESHIAQLGRFEKEWRATLSNGRPCKSSSNVESPQDAPITLDTAKAACKSFEMGTAVGTDGLRPRHLLHLPNEGLQLLACILNFSELSGLVPVLGANVVFLPKPTGGERPIGILPTLYRVWCRCRRRVAVAWEQAFQCPYFWAAAAGPTA